MKRKPGTIPAWLRQARRDHLRGQAQTILAFRLALTNAGLRLLLATRTGQPLRGSAWTIHAERLRARWRGEGFDTPHVDSMIRENFRRHMSHVAARSAERVAYMREQNGGFY